MIPNAAFPSFRLLCLIGFLAFVSYDLIRSPLLPLFAEGLGARPEGIGLIVGASTLTGILLKLPAGTLSDLIGRRRLLFIGLSVFVLAPYFYFGVMQVWPLILLRAFHGLATALFAPVAMAVVVDLFREARGEALSWYSSFTQAGRLSGRMMGGYLVVWFGFQQVFAVCAVIGLILIVLFLMLKLPEDRSKTSGGHESFAALLQGLREVGRERRVLVTSAMEGILMTASGALMAFLPLYGIKVGLNAGEVGLLFGTMGIASILARPMMGRLSDRIGRRPLILTGQILCAAVMISLPWTAGLVGLLFLSLIFGLGEAVIGSSTSALVADLCKEKSLGSAMGVFGTIMDIGHAGGPILTGFLIGLSGYTGAFGGIGVILLSVTALFAATVRED
ncbi:MAG TPA: MFS transporter [Nitrospiria bacterium]|jgi:MFS family permease|nr:MFS transporter [Nitrospiria bacterium]